MGLLQDRLSNQAHSEVYSNPPKINIHMEQEYPMPEQSPIKCNAQEKEKKSLFSGKTVSQKEEIVTEPEEMTEEMLLAYELKKSHDEKVKLQKSRNSEKFVNIICVILCGYLIFLIYGVICTNYHYNDSGVIEPQVLSVSDIREGKKFDVILVQYENCRLLYEKILMLDYRLGQGVEDPLVIAPEYEKMLDEVENLSVKINALDSDTKYEQIKNMMSSWIQNDTAIYLQKMSSAISQNNSDDASIALSYQNAMYNNFSTITENIVVMGEAIEGVDVTEIKNWSPERYIDQAINGK